MGGEGGGGGEEDECSGYRGIGPTGNCGYHQKVRMAFQSVKRLCIELASMGSLTDYSHIDNKSSMISLAQK